MCTKDYLINIQMTWGDCINLKSIREIVLPDTGSLSVGFSQWSCDCSCLLDMANIPLDCRTRTIRSRTFCEGKETLEVVGE